MAAAFVLGGVRLRTRLSGLVTLEQNGPKENLPGDRTPDALGESWVLASAPDVAVDDDILRDACSYAGTRGLEVLDLVPRDLRVGQVLELADEVKSPPLPQRPPRKGTGSALTERRAVYDELLSEGWSGFSNPHATRARDADPATCAGCSAPGTSISTSPDASRWTGAERAGTSSRIGGFQRRVSISTISTSTTVWASRSWRTGSRRAPSPTRAASHYSPLRQRQSAGWTWVLATGTSAQWPGNDGPGPSSRGLTLANRSKRRRGGDGSMPRTRASSPRWPASLPIATTW